MTRPAIPIGLTTALFAAEAHDGFSPIGRQLSNAMRDREISASNEKAFAATNTSSQDATWWSDLLEEMQTDLMAVQKGLLGGHTAPSSPNQHHDASWMDQLANSAQLPGSDDDLP